MIKDAVNGRKAKSSDNSIDFKCGHDYQKRRINALMTYVPFLAKMFKEQYPNSFVENLIINMLRSPAASLPDMIFKRNEKSFARPITVAIALFILDDLLQNENLWEALLYLPEYDATSEEIWDENFNDATFPNDVILSLAQLIEKRNNDTETFLTPTSARRTRENVHPLEHRCTNITQPMYNSRDDIVVAIRKQALQMSYRERLDKIMSLMSKATVEQAEDHFKAQLLSFFKITIELTHDFDTQTLVALNEIETNLHNLEALADNFVQTMQQTETLLTIKQQQLGSYCGPVNDANKLRDDAIVSGLDTIAKYMDSVSTRDTMSAKYVQNIENAQNTLEKLDADYRVIIYLLENGHNHCFKYDGRAEIIDKINTLGIDNPYETIFGYFWLLDRGDDIVWLVEPAASVTNIAIGKLPWTAYNETFMRDDYSSVTTDSRCATIAPLDNDLLAPLYDKKYNDYVYWCGDALNDISPDDLVNVNYSQLVYDLSNLVVCRHSDKYQESVRKALMRTGIKKRNVPAVQLMLETMLAETQKHKIKLFNDHTDETDEAAVQQAMKQTIEEKTAKIDKLAAELYDANKKAKDEQARADQIAENSRLEHNELIELRELVYKMQNEASINDVTTRSNTTLPYETKQNIIAFGGHDTWLKAIKPLLPNVKFVPPTVNPDSQLFRNADVIWMQSNAMPHSFYNKIMDLARTHKIPVKYFAYASAEKCAYQLAETDMGR